MATTTSAAWSTRASVSWAPRCARHRRPRHRLRRRRGSRPTMKPFGALLLLALAASEAAADGVGYYRFPALYKNTLVFVAEGDLWQVPSAGGVAQRLTTHPGDETRPAFSPDGQTLAFSASYEGPAEVYTMPVAGGLPTRRTHDGGGAQVVGFTPAGKILYATRHYSTLPDAQLAEVDPKTGVSTLVPLSQASDGAWDPQSGALFFTRLPFQGSYTK